VTRSSFRRTGSGPGSIAVLLAGLLLAVPVSAQQLSPEEEMARKAADPLGDVRAVMSDNTIALQGGETGDDTTFGFQLQPVYAIPNETRVNIIARAIVPIIGVEPGVVVPPIGPAPRPDRDSKWGLSDTVAQLFFSPKTDGAVKWGIGPQVSLKTHTSDRTAGPGWGGGFAGVIFGAAGQWSFGAVVMQHWGERGGYSILTVQPIAIYLVKSLPGVYIGYNNAMTYDWKAASGNAFALPLGLTVGKTLVVGDGDGLDLSVGAYPLAVRPDHAPKWQLKVGVSYFFN